MIPSLHAASAAASPELREAFRGFVGQTLFSQMFQSMRETLGKPAYLHGGRAEEIFQSQLDQMLIERMSTSSGDPLADPLLEGFLRNKPSPAASQATAALDVRA